MVTVTTSGTWKRASAMPPEDLRGEGTNQVRWGAADEKNRETGYTFTGGTTDARLDGHDFLLGTLTYDNFIRDPGVYIFSFWLSLTVRVAVQGGPEAEFTYFASHGDLGDQLRDVPDVLTFMTSPPEQSITIDGVPYTVVLCGFPTGRDEPPTSELRGPEKTSTSVELRAMFVRRDGVHVAIRDVHYAGTPDEEYAEIVNHCATGLGVAGWVLNAGDVGQDYTFRPDGIGPARAIRVYTGTSAPGWGTYSFNTRRTIWQDKGDTAELRDQKGNVIARYAYGNAAG